VVKGLSARAARAALIAKGFEVEFRSADAPPAERTQGFTVQSQSPLPETTIKRGTSVTIRVYARWQR
jgi:beta-lactam-binding protein with PASTA domain